MVDQLVIALRQLENMYWRQSDPEALALYNALEGDKTPLAQTLRRYLVINGSRFDLVDENRPFVGTAPMPPGPRPLPAGSDARGRRGLRRERIRHESRVIYNPYTVVAAASGADLAGRAVSRRVRRVRPAAPPRRCARRPISPTTPRSPTSCGCAPTRCSPTTTTTATSRGSS